MGWGINLLDNAGGPVNPPVNILSANQSGIETDLTGFGAESNVGLTRYTFEAFDGLASLNVVLVAGYTPEQFFMGSGSSAPSSPPAIGRERFDVVVGATYTVAYVAKNLNDGTQKLTTVLEYWDADDNFLTSTVTESSPSFEDSRGGGPGNWIANSCGLEAPAGASYATLAFLVTPAFDYNFEWLFDSFELSEDLGVELWPFTSATFHWELDGPGSVEVDLKKGTESDWLAGQRQLVLRDPATEDRFWAGWLTALAQSGPPRGEKFRASGLGLASRLAKRIVHGDFSRQMAVATDTAWDLIEHAQAQTDGDMGFTFGTVEGTATTRSRDYCDGDDIGAAIDELADFATGGFDWEIDAYGAFNAWVGGRGDTTAESLAPGDVRGWGVENETDELITYATALADVQEACGDPVEVASDAGNVALYGRLEDSISIDTDDSDELEDAALAEIESRMAGSLRLKVNWIEGHENSPWAFGAVWLGDVVPNVELRDVFGGPQDMRVVSITLSLEGRHEFVEYELELVR